MTEPVEIANQAVVTATQDFFNPDLYRTHPSSQATCWGCNRPWDQCNPGKKLKAEFLSFTGIPWPSTPMICYNIRKDFRQLGLETQHVPEELSLCLPCSIDYMRSFNSLMDQQRKRNKPPKEKPAGPDHALLVTRDTEVAKRSGYDITEKEDSDIVN